MAEAPAASAGLTRHPAHASNRESPCFRWCSSFMQGSALVRLNPFQDELVLSAAGGEPSTLFRPQFQAVNVSRRVDAAKTGAKSANEFLFNITASRSISTVVGRPSIS